MRLIHLSLAAVTLIYASSVLAVPMPNTIMVEDKAVVPVLKTEVIRRIAGQQPVRHVEATILEVMNKGKDIVAKEVVFEDNLGQFSEKTLAIPVLKKGGVVVPTSKIEVNKTLKKEGTVLHTTKTIDAEGVEIKKDQSVLKRTLRREERTETNQDKVVHTVMTEDGSTTQDTIEIQKPK